MTESETEALLSAYVNPLLFDFEESSGGENQDVANKLLRFLLVGNPSEELPSIINKRKTRLAPVAQKLYALPADQRISDKLIAPLRQAYAAFLVGNFLGTLALCGMIGEMAAIFLFDVMGFQINGRVMTQDDQAGLFGDQFERLGQERRIRILRTYGVIKEDAAADLEKIRKIRNNYLHYWNKDRQALENDAFQVLVATIETILRLFPQTFEKGRMRLSRHIIKYLEREQALVPKNAVKQDNKVLEPTDEVGGSA